jgi:hypothetical protein
MAKTIRQKRFSVATSLAAAIVAFPPFLVLAGVIAHRMLIAIVDSGFRFWGVPDEVVIAFFAAIAVVLAYIPCRMIYMALHWKTVEDSGRYCRSCGYDLTGNVSGRCPECGERISA